MKPHIINETDPLKKVLVWGEPGCEALLAQLLPKSKSLFRTYYEVMEARAEFRRMQTLIESEKVEVIRAKDAYVGALEKIQFHDLPTSISGLESSLLELANSYFETFKNLKTDELENSRHSISIDEIYEQVRSDLKYVLKEDADSYGEQNAIKLNYKLSLAHEMPICNIFYGRDQSNTLGDKILISSMRWDIRRPEVEIYKTALTELGCGNHMTEITNGWIEGGDSIIYGDTCYIGVGARTTLTAVRDVYEKLGSNFEKYGIDIAAVINERHEKEAASPSDPKSEHMQAMHLDMFWIPLSENLVLAGGEIDNRKIIKITSKNGTVELKELGNFRSYMSKRGIDIIEVTPQEQKDYAVNLLNFGNNKLLVALSKNVRVIREMEKRGFIVIPAELNKLVGGYGAAHCLTAPMVRKSGSRD